MSDGVVLALSSAIAGLAGSIPFSLLVARYGGGIDLRKHGSGNVGATNVARVLGPKWGSIALILDALKGMLPVLLLPYFLPTSESAHMHQMVLCGVWAVLGHVFSPFLGFRGGKGVATALGSVVILAPWATLGAFVTFVVSFAAFRIVSLSSMLAAVGFAILQAVLFRQELWTSTHWSLGLFSIAVPLLILLRHRTNFLRLLHGKEPKLQFRRSKSQEESPADVAKSG